MAIQCLHVATHGHNIGDGALVAGIHRTLREDLSEEIVFTPYDVLEKKLRREFAMFSRSELDEVQAKFDLILVGGGGMIEGGPRNHLSGINFNFDPDLLDHLRIPMVFYALGFNQFRRSFFFHKSALEKLLAQVEARGLLFSVRNDRSKERLERLVGEVPFVDTIPDPGLFVPPATRPVPELKPGVPNLVLQLAGDRARQRFGGPLARIAQRLRGEEFFRNLARIVETWVLDEGYHVILCPHLMTDWDMYSRLLDQLSPRVMRSGLTSSSILVGSQNAGAFFELYRRADVVVGMRGHSSICAVGVGTPFVGIGSHDKVAGFLDEMELSDWCVDLNRDPKLESLADRVGQALNQPESLRSSLRDRNRVWRERAREFHSRIATQIGVTPCNA